MEEEKKIVHKMHLQNEPFNAIKDKKKTVELRLFDDKRKEIQIGDQILFINLLNPKLTLLVDVIGLCVYSSFEKLYAYYDKVALGYNENEPADYKDMYQYYKEDEIKEYGVLAIEMKLHEGEN